MSKLEQARAAMEKAKSETDQFVLEHSEPIKAGEQEFLFDSSPGLTTTVGSLRLTAVTLLQYNLLKEQQRKTQKKYTIALTENQFTKNVEPTKLKQWKIKIKAKQ